MADTLPTSDDFFGPAKQPTQSGQAPTADEFFAPQGPSFAGRVMNAMDPRTGFGILSAPVTGNPATDQAISLTGTGRVLQAFGQGAKNGWGSEPIAIPDPIQQTLKKSGFWDEYANTRNTHLKSFNEVLFRPAAAALDRVLGPVMTDVNALVRGFGAGVAGTEHAIYQAGKESGQEGLAKAGIEATEVLAAGGHMMSPIPHFAVPPVSIPRARALGVIGEGEGGYSGVRAPEPLTDAARADAVKQAITEQAEAPQPTGMPEEAIEQPGASKAATPPADVTEPAPGQAAIPDIHAVAREIAPDTFREYDNLSQRRDTYRRWMDELRVTRQEQAEAAAPHTAEIEELHAKMEDATPRLQKKYQARLDVLEPANEAFIESKTSVDTPDMARVRADLQKSDYRMRDLAPDVAKAYRDAQERQGAAPEVAEPVAPEAAAPQAVPKETAAEALPESPRVTPEEAQQPTGPNVVGEKLGSQTTQAHLDTIAADVAKKLEGAGRPKEEAAATGQIIAAHYEARAARFKGEQGNALELFNREAPYIRAAKVQKAKEFAQGKTLEQGKKGSITLGNARNTIKIFKDADASTAIHEFGHDWLEELFRDAGTEGVVDQVKADAGTVRDWLGVKEGENIPTKAHEKFARGFERYMMEGVAPSAKLAKVFAQFKDWLTKIYQTVQKLRSPINDDIRAVFDRMLAENPEKTVIAPDREAPEHMADFHEREAETTAPEHADKAGDQIRADIDEAVKQTAPEVHDELPHKQAGGIPRADTVPDRGGNAPESVRGSEADAAERGQVAEGGNQAAPKGGKSPGGTVRIPREPQRLIDFVRSKGGIKDDRGDIATLVSGDKKALRKLLKKDGESLDEMTRMAWDAGYFPEASERPTTVEMIEALGSDYRGDARYSLHDMEDVQAYRDALQHNAEADRIGNELGLDTRDPDFWSKVADHMSVEELAAEQTSQAEHFANEMASAEKAAKEYVESRGESWEPDEVYADASRSLEDLEREREQENASRRAGQSQGRTEDGFAPGDQGQVQEGDGSRGNGPEPSGRERGEEPTDGADLLARPEADDLVDKAGNIRLENLGTPEDVNAVIRQISTENSDFIAARRGVISDAEVIDLANDLGMDAATLDRRKIGEAFNAEQVVAARKLLIQSATELREVMAKAANGQDADVMAYAQARDRHIMIQRQVAGLTAEAGRALRAFRKLEGQENAELLGKIIQDETGRTLNQLKKEAAMGAQLDTPAKVSKFMNDSVKPTFLDMITEFWINSLLSGPKTHVKNIVGNAVVALNSVAETAGASVVGRVLNSAERVEFNEAKARFFGITQGAKDGVIAAKAIMASEDAISATAHTVEKANQKAIPGAAGKVIRIPTRLLSMEDEFFKAIGYRQELNALAYREANKLGLTGSAFDAKVADIITSPSEAMMEAAKKAAEYQTFTNPLGPTGRAIQNFANSHFLAKFLVPFIRTPVNLLKFAGERTVLGLASKSIRDTVGGTDTIARDTQISRMAIGTGISVAVAYAGLAMEGAVTGGGPSDPKQRAALRMTGWQPYSVRVGGMYYSYQWLDPFSTIAGITADMADVAHFGQAKGEEWEKIAADAMGSLVKSAASKTSLRGISDFLQMASDPDRYGENYIQGFAAGFVPGLLGQTASIMDPQLRQTRTALDTMKAKIPGLSQELLPRRDIWGNELSRGGALGPDILSSVYETEVNDDPVNKAMLKSGYFPSYPSRKIRGVELTDQQYDDYARIGGRMAKMQLDAIVKLPGFDQLPAMEKLTIMRSTVEHSRESARSLILLQNPELIQKAVKGKLQAELGEDPSP